MKCRPLHGDDDDDERWRVYLAVAEFVALLESVPEHASRRARLAFRLMAMSMRIGTAADVRVGQFETRDTPSGTLVVCPVEAKDSTERDSATRPRDVWIPQPLAEKIYSYIKDEGLQAGDPLINVGKRQVSNWVEDARENAAVRMDKPEFRRVTSHDFRRYFASHLLFRHEVPPHIVRQLGGWESERAMREYLLVPDDVLASTLGEVGILGAQAMQQTGETPNYRVETAFDTIRDALSTAGPDERRQLAQRLEDVAESTDALEVETGVSSDTVERAMDAKSEPSQQSLDLAELDSDVEGRVTAVVAAVGGLIPVVVLGTQSLLGLV